VAADHGMEHLRCGFHLQLEGPDAAPGSLLNVRIEGSNGMLINSPQRAVAQPGASVLGG
jgi:hypothetical protein